MQLVGVDTSQPNMGERLPLTHVEGVTDRAGLGLLEMALRGHHRTDTHSSITWWGTHGANVTATKIGDEYKLVYVAPMSNDKDLLSAFSAVCNHGKGKVTIHRNADHTLVDRLRHKAVALQMKGDYSKARSYMTAHSMLKVASK